MIEENWLQGSTGITSEVLPEESQKKLDGLVKDIRTLIANANDIIGSPNNKENLQKILANLTEATEQAKKTMQEFREFAVAGTTTLKNADAKTEELVVAMVDTSQEIGKVATRLWLILEKINNGQGSAAKLINDGRFYEDLLENSQQLKLLLQEVRDFIAESREKGIKVKL